MPILRHRDRDIPDMGPDDFENEICKKHCCFYGSSYMEIDEPCCHIVTCMKTKSFLREVG